MLHDQDLVSVQEARAKVEKAWAAWQKYRHFTQEQIDAVVEKMAEVGKANSVRLAEMAVEETSYGNVQDKIAKNLLNSDLLPRAIRNMKTVGLLRELPDQKIVEYGVPVGVVAAIIPTTNPTSTVFYKSIISLKAGNGIVISPHPRAKVCTCYTADLMHKAAVDAGAPEDLIQCINNPTLEATKVLMQHKRTAVILSTGGAGIVRAAYSSGKPALGVGPGNVPSFIDRTANIAEAVERIVIGKSFDYGTVCSSEQTLVAEQALRATVLNELQARKAYLCTREQADALARLLVLPDTRINPECVGQAPTKIAQMAGFSVPADTSILCAEIEGVGKEHPLSMEKLSPVLALYFVPDYQAALAACEAILRFGGLGHTCVIFSKDEARIREFAEKMPAMRVMVNTASPQGSVGITTNLLPSMTLGCGAAAGNSTSDNVGPQHLINIKRLAYAVRTPEEALSIPKYTGTPKPATASAGTAAGTAVDVTRDAIVAAVERYLAQRGVSSAPPLSAARPAPAQAAEPKADAASLTSGIVDRFLAGKIGHSPLPPSSTPPCKCGEPSGGTCSVATAPAASAPDSPPPPAVKPSPVAFVCEDDVRAAIAAKKKIYIGKKTIVTPSARDLGNTYDVLVQMEL